MELSVLNCNFPAAPKAYLDYAAEKDGCRQCDIFSHYRKVIQSEGCTTDPTFMFIGEGPGQDEVEQNRPFIGRAGQRLRKEIRKHRKVFNKETTIISNVLGCRPLDNKFPKDTALVDTCVELWLFREIELLKPKVIIVLGNPALLHVREETGITNCRGGWKFLPEFRAWSMATFHPCYVLRQSHMGYIEQQFEKDIETVANDWHVVVGADRRMSMSEDQWLTKRAFDIAIKKGMIKDYGSID